MKKYALTVFAKNGKILMDHSFHAKYHDEAKVIAQKLLNNEGYENYTHRCVTSDGSLLIFHR